MLIKRLYHELRQVRKLERTIDTIKRSNPKSSESDFAFSWDRLQHLLVEERENINVKAIEQPLRVPKEFRQRPKLQLYLQKASPATLAAAAVRALKPKGDGPKLPPKNRKGKPKGKLGKAMSAEEKDKKPLHFPLNWFYLFFSRHEQHTHTQSRNHARRYM